MDQPQIAIESDPVLIELRPQPRPVAAGQGLRHFNDLRQAQLLIPRSLDDRRNRRCGILNLAVGCRHGASRLSARARKPLASARSLQGEHASTRMKSTRACPELTDGWYDRASRLGEIDAAVISPAREPSLRRVLQFHRVHGAPRGRKTLVNSL
jgi:hypothetical protein